MTVGCDGDGNERLPVFHRTIRAPGSPWKSVKRTSADDAKAIRQVVVHGRVAQLPARRCPITPTMRRHTRVLRER